ncbi:MAG: ATP-binding protein, partial [bacterium]|nr:ATP-binding protein [bacterium]
MYLSETISEKWQPVMEHKDLPEIKDNYRRDVTLRLLENQEAFLKEAAPTNATGGAIDNWDPILISLVRRSMPQMIAYDVCGVQPMTGPTGLIFAMKSRYTNQGGAEAFGATGTGADEADTDFSGRNAAGANGSATAHVPTDGTNNPFDGTWTGGTGMTTAQAEALGDAANNQFAEMAFSIDKTSVTAKSRALKAEYSTELAQDLKAVHGLDAETELANILSTEILQEINREVIRTIYTAAKPGAQANTTAAGTFDLDTDSNGRWSVEKFKGLMFQIERDRNEIGHQTRRGKGNFMICSADVASAMSMAGMLETGHSVNPDDTMSTLAGTM